MEGNECVVSVSAVTFRGGGFASIASNSLSKRDSFPMKREIFDIGIANFPLHSFDLTTYPATLQRFTRADMYQILYVYFQ